MKKLTKELKREWESMMRNSKTEDTPYVIGQLNVGMFTCHGNRLDSIGEMIKTLEAKCGGT